MKNPKIVSCRLYGSPILNPDDYIEYREPFWDKYDVYGYVCVIMYKVYFVAGLCDDMRIEDISDCYRVEYVFEEED